jgi:predicted metal-dependent phosphoesterase TrpH
MCTQAVLKSFCRESYSSPESIYEQLKRRGMDLVTITDHDSIDASEALRGRPDYFVSEEVTCRMPSGTEAHVGVYDISEPQHVNIQRRRNDLPSLVAYCEEERLFFSVKHAFSQLTGRRRLEDFELFAKLFPAFEIRNGHLAALNNGLAARLARQTGKAEIGGSDAHTLRTLGCAYTEVFDARNKQEFFDGLRLGRGRAGGEAGAYWKMAREFLLIGLAMIAEQPACAILAPLALGIPVAALINYVQELSFARKWERELAAKRDFRDAACSERRHTKEALA